MVTLKAFASTHFTLKGKTAKRFKPDGKTKEAQTSCLKRANIPPGEIQADIATNTGEIYCKKIERIRLERCVPEGALVSNLNCRAKVYLRRGSTLFELICDIDAKGELIPVINGANVDISSLPQESKYFFDNLKLIIATGWEKILVTTAPKAVLRAPQAPPKPSAAAGEDHPQAPKTYEQRARAGFVVDSPTITSTSNHPKTRQKRLAEKMKSLLPILTKTTPITASDLASLGNVTLVKKEFVTPCSDETVFVPIQNQEEAIARLEAIRTSNTKEGLEELFVCMQPGYTRILSYNKPDPEEGTLTQKPSLAGKLSNSRRRYLEQQGITLADAQRTIPYPLKTKVMLEARNSAGQLTAIPIVIDDLIGLKEGRLSTQDGVSDGAARIEQPEDQIHVEYETQETEGVQERIVTRVVAIIPDVERSIGYVQGDMISLGDLLRNTGNL